MAKRKPIKVKYILNPGDGRDVETFVGEIATRRTIATNVIRTVWPRYEEAHEEDPLASLYRVLYAGRKLIFEQFNITTTIGGIDGAWMVLEPDERMHIAYKVLEHIR